MATDEAVRRALMLVKEAAYNDDLDENDPDSWMAVARGLEEYLRIADDVSLDDVLGNH